MKIIYSILNEYFKAPKNLKINPELDKNSSLFLTENLVNKDTHKESGSVFSKNIVHYNMRENVKISINQGSIL
jgi:hypothetical protein